MEELLRRALQLARDIKEGKVPEEADKEEDKIKKLTEKDEEFMDPDVDPRDEPEEEEPEVDPIKPKSGEEEEAPEIIKELVGNTEDTFFYMISVEDDNGDVKDLNIVDQESVTKFSAREHGIDFMNIPEFLFKAIKELEMENIEFSVFDKYLFPYVFEEEEEEDTGEDEEEVGLEPVDDEEKPPRESRVSEAEDDKKWGVLLRGSDIGQNKKKAQPAGSKEEAKAKAKRMNALLSKGEKSYYKLKYVVVPMDEQKVSEKKRLMEMKITDNEDNEFEVYVVDDGTLDTVIDVAGKEIRFDAEFARLWRDEEGNLSEEGLRELALDALSSLGEDEYNELVARAADQEENGIQATQNADSSGSVDADVARGDATESKIAEGGYGPRDTVKLVKRDDDEWAVEYYVDGKYSEDKTYYSDDKLDAEDTMVDIQQRIADAQDKAVGESKTNEATMGVDYIRKAKAGMKDAQAAMRDKDYDRASEILDGIADDCSDGAKAAKKMKIVADDKAEKAAEKEKEATEKESVEEDVDEKKKPPVCSKCNNAHWPFQKCGGKKEASDEKEVEEGGQTRYDEPETKDEEERLARRKKREEADEGCDKKKHKKEVAEDVKEITPGQYEVVFYDGHKEVISAESPYAAKKKGEIAYSGSPVSTTNLVKQTGDKQDVHFRRDEADLPPHKDHIPGGMGDKKVPSDFDEEQIKWGIEIEMEHTDDPAIAREISIDHLTEDPEYYTKLRKMEAGECAEGVDNLGVRDGTGPAKGSLQRKKYRDVGKRKQAGEECPIDDFNEAAEGLHQTEDEIVKHVQDRARFMGDRSGTPKYVVEMDGQRYVSADTRDLVLQICKAKGIQCHETKVSVVEEVKEKKSKPVRESQLALALRKGDIDELTSTILDMLR